VNGQLQACIFPFTASLRPVSITLIGSRAQKEELRRFCPIALRLKN
jgi:hypothetical protein